jgi:hypothetical protein
MGLAGLAAALAFVLVPAAAQASPRPTISTALSAGTTPSFVSSLDAPQSGTGPVMIGDGFGIDPPTLFAAPGTTVTIAVDAPVDAVEATWSIPRLPDPATWTPLTVAPSGDRTYTVTLPADASLPGEFWVTLEYSTDTMVGRSSWKLILDAVPASAPPPPSPPQQPATPQPEPPAAALAARVKGRRLSVLVACPIAAVSGCSGVLTVRSASQRVARLPFKLAAGKQRTLRTTLTRRVAKHLGRELRAELAAPGRPVVRGRLVVR